MNDRYVEDLKRELLRKIVSVDRIPDTLESSYS